MSNSLDQDQARHIVRPDLGPNCLQKLSADDTRRKLIRRPYQSVHFDANRIKIGSKIRKF